MAPIISNIAKKRSHCAVFLFLVAALLLIPGTGSLPLMDRDEPRFAQATHEMIESGNWGVPYFNGDYRFDKPPLTYWWMSVHYRVFGKSEFSARLHSVIGAWLVALVITAFGRRFFSAGAGLLAGLCWLTMFQVLIHGRLAVADMPMIWGMVISMYALARILAGDDKDRFLGLWFWVLVAGFTIGFYAKGPVGWGVLVLAMIIYSFILNRKGDPVGLAWLKLGVAMLMALGLVAIWGIPANLQTDWAYWGTGIGEHVVRRGTEAFNGRVFIPVVYYLITAFVSLLPWSPFIPCAFRKNPGQDKRSDIEKLLLAWLIAPYLIFSFYTTQLPHYVMPGFPALALLLFSGGELKLPRSKFERIWFWSVVGLFVVLGLVLLLVSFRLPLAGDVAALKWIAILAACVVLLLGISAYLMKYSFRWAAIPLFMTSILAMWTGEQIRSVHPVIRAQEAFALAPESSEYRASDFAEPSLVFYNREKWQRDKPYDMNFRSERLVRMLNKKKLESPRVGLFLGREWTVENIVAQFGTGEFAAKLLADPSSLEAAKPKYDRREEFKDVDTSRYQIVTISGFNFARFSWAELAIVIPLQPGQVAVSP